METPQPQPEEYLVGPVDKSRRRDDLMAIAKALEITGHDTEEFSRITKAKLLPLIQKHLSENSKTLSTAVRFQKLYTYGKRSSARGPKVPGKNSAHKTAEDVVEQGKLQAEIRGAHKALLDAKRTTDPPGQTRQYQASVTQAEDGTRVSARHTQKQPKSPSLSPLPSSPTTPLSPAPLSPTLPSLAPPSTPPPLLPPAVDSPVVGSGWPDGFELPVHGLEQVNQRCVGAQVDLQPPSSGPALEQPVPPPGRFMPANLPVLPSTPQRQKRTKSDVCVTFRDYDGHHDAQQVWVANMPIEVRLGANGGRDEFFTRLSDVVPAALEQDTPLRTTLGRVWRDAASGDRAKTHIGSVAALIEERQTKALLLPHVNNYHLTQLPDGELACNLLLQREPEPSGVSLTASRTTSHRQTTPPSPSPVRHKSTSRSKAVDKATPNFTHEDTLAYLRQALNAPSEWPRAETAGQCLPRFLAARDAWSYLRALGVTQPSGGGWKFPDDHDEVPGAKFVKETVLEALNIKKGTANADENLFKIESSGQRSLQDWIDDPDDSALSAKFSKLFINQLKKWKRRHSGPLPSGSSKQTTRDKGKDVVRKGSSSKRGRNEVTSDSSGSSRASDMSDSDSVVTKMRKGKAKSSSIKKHKYAHDSDLLDD